MPAEALDMSLDDLVAGDRGSKGRGRGGKSKGKGKGKSFKIWGGSKGSAKGKSKGWKKFDKGDKEASGEKKEKVSEGEKLDMSLDEVIEKTSTKGKGKGKRAKGEDGERKGKGKSSGGSSWGKGGGDYYQGGGYKGDRSKGYGKDRTKGYGKERTKGYSKGRQSNDDYNPAWNEHDDRDGVTANDDAWVGGRGKGRDSGSSYKGGGRAESYGDSRGRLAPERRVSRASADGGWQTVAQDRAPIRDARSPPPRRREEPAPRRREVETRDTRKRRSAEEEERPSKRVKESAGSSTCKSVKVTNIPRDVNVQDIKDAFEQETGKIARCRLDKGTAWIAFSKPSDARKAIETFDRGELNGKTIGVVLDQ